MSRTPAPLKGRYARLCSQTRAFGNSWKRSRSKRSVSHNHRSTSKAKGQMSSKDVLWTKEDPLSTRDISEASNIVDDENLSPHEQSPLSKLHSEISRSTATLEENRRLLREYHQQINGSSPSEEIRTTAERQVLNNKLDVFKQNRLKVSQQHILPRREHSPSNNDNLQLSMVNLEIESRSLKDEMTHLYRELFSAFSVGKWVDLSDMKVLKLRKQSMLDLLNQFCRNLTELRQQITRRRENDRLAGTELEACRQELRQRLETVEAQCDTLRGMVVEKDQIIIDLQQEIKVRQREMENEVKQLESVEITRMGRQLHIKEEDCARLHRQLVTLEHQLDHERSKNVRFNDLLSETRLRMEHDHAELRRISGTASLNDNRSEAACNALRIQLTEKNAAIARLGAQLATQSKSKLSTDIGLQCLSTSVPVKDNMINKSTNTSFHELSNCLDKPQVTISFEEAVHEKPERLVSTTDTIHHNTSTIQPSKSPILSRTRTLSAGNESATEDSHLIKRITKLEEELKVALADVIKLTRDKDIAKKKHSRKLKQQRQHVCQLQDSNEALQVYIQHLKASYCRVFGDGALPLANLILE